MHITEKYGANEIASQLHEGLQRYLEAQYPIRDIGIIQERRALLQEYGCISQQPFIETTPTYAFGDAYNKLQLPDPLSEAFNHFSQWQPGIGIFPQPYAHQAQALTAFFKEDKDLIVATGTGSGKTETFLLPILGNLLREAHTLTSSFQRPGCRALLLYPMNALVSDQVSRLRRLFGDERLKQYFLLHYGRFPRFGMYTGRTPYPGLRESDKDKNVEEWLSYYLKLEEAFQKDPTSKEAELKRELQIRGRWPAKDIRNFLGEKGSLWRNRLQTQAMDSELLTRHEMQQNCPDILVTNYSILEYMLVRPIERSIFQQTAEWLKQDKSNSLLLVLDEAHMYRGVAGAEVALLLRRLRSRLDIPQGQLRCILTSASLEVKDKESAKKIFTFAENLTGNTFTTETSFDLIQGQREQRPAARLPTEDELKFLAQFDLQAFFRRTENINGAIQAISVLGQQLHWPPLSIPTSHSNQEASETQLQTYLYDQLYGFGPLEYIIHATTSEAHGLHELTKNFSPVAEFRQAEAAISTLLALGTYATKNKRALMPTRLHLFFRGLPTIYACINPNCDKRRYLPQEHLLLGRLHTEPQTHCTCNLKGRVFELITHRSCGASFLRVFGQDKEADFYWHEQGGSLKNFSTPLIEAWLLLEEPHPSMRDKVEQIWLDIATGRVITRQPDNIQRYLQCWRVSQQQEHTKKQINSKKKRSVQLPGSESEVTNDDKEQTTPIFTTCPVCTRKNMERKTSNLATRGEQPFANLVRHQFQLQPAVKDIGPQTPNGGRKLLLFSDGRQKAARLARDLPREVEFDTFRQALVIAVQRLQQMPTFTPRLNETLYVSFVSVCADFNLHFFDQNDESQSQLLRHITHYQEYYDSILEDALYDGWQPTTLPEQYKIALLKQLCDPYYSLSEICAAVVIPQPQDVKRFIRKLNGLPLALNEQEVATLITLWIQQLLGETAFDHTIREESRWDVDTYFRGLSHKQSLKKMEHILDNKNMSIDQTQLQPFHEKCCSFFCEEINDTIFLKPAALQLVLTIDDDWQHCLDCGTIQHTVLRQCCTQCGSQHLEQRSPQHPSMKSRKGYFLDPLREVLHGKRPVHITAEEHSAQLSQRDERAIYATTEEHELRFQDVAINHSKPPVDILSCTTTMEVGIDIGSLTAIGLRNVPPQRENYQQRAGRAGRRGTAVSTVLTYAQGGAHENYYYEHPQEIISGKLRDPLININNPRLVTRHIHAFLIQTFFQKQLAHMSEQALQQLIQQHPHVMNSLGTAHAFFQDTGSFSLSAFRRWVTDNILELTTSTTTTLISWLPDELCPTYITTKAKQQSWKHAFITEVANNFLAQLETIATEKTYVTKSVPLDREKADIVTNQRIKAVYLLDVLFDQGLLPSYAFPTDLSSFSVFEKDGERVLIKERPQQSKSQALSEYAPGRLLVINKKTYRVGGIYDEQTPYNGISLQNLQSYVSCEKCTYVREKSLNNEQECCPICGGELSEREMLDPPGFSPEGAKPLREHDREQHYSNSSVAQLPLPTKSDQFEWNTHTFPYARYTYAQNRRLILVNKGPAQEGFRLCQECGAIWPEVQYERQKPTRHVRPFLVDYRHFKRKMGQYCTGPIYEQSLYLGYTFNTDLLLFRFALREPLSCDPQSPWLHDGLRTLAEAVALTASRYLDVDANALSANYRLIPALIEEGSDAKLFVDIYLFDTASGGAGYSAEAGKYLSEILQATEKLLSNCPAHCERSCTRCLRHYGNRFWHEQLDRFLARQLLAYALYKQIPEVGNIKEQIALLSPLKRFLELDGYICKTDVTTNKEKVPLMVESHNDNGMKAPLVILAHPALRDAPKYKEKTIWLNEYIIAHDLPTAYQQIISHVRKI
ncbi:DEAD/DEAH box helicase [Dictyobacter vulcani]|nr:DEAD/DEAH box helicase [Dictyobacter vulcani]